MEEAVTQGDLYPLCRDAFRLPEGQAYLLGNSLGPLCLESEKRILQVLEEWGRLGVGGWSRGSPRWFTWVESLAERLAPLLGARPGELTLGDSLTVQLLQILHTFYERQDLRRSILTDAMAFPSDRHAIAGFLESVGFDPARQIQLCQPADGLLYVETEICRRIEALRGDVQLVVLPSVVYTTGQLLDVPAITACAHANGMLIAWDLAHSVGIVPHQLHDWEVDFAYFCTYKYLNSGPGGVGGLFVHARHHGRWPGLRGWFGLKPEARFSAAAAFEGPGNAQAFQIGTPPVLLLAALEGSLQLLESVGIERIRARSLAYTAYLRHLLQEDPGTAKGVRIVTPPEAERRGGQITLQYAHADDLKRALLERGILVDGRSPDLLRMAPSPLFNTAEEIESAAAQIARLVDQGFSEGGGRSAEQELVP